MKTLASISLPYERENIRWALSKLSAVGWTEADEELAMRIYASNSKITAEQAASQALVLGSKFLKEMREE